MKRVNVLNIILELIVVFGYIVIGMTCLTYIFQHASADRFIIGAIVGAVGILQFASYFTHKFVVRVKSIQSAVGALVMVALGIVFIVVDIEPDLACILVGAFCIGINIISITTSAITLTNQPLYNSARMIIDIISIVFSIFLIVKGEPYFYTYMTFVGIALLVIAVVLLIEFIIHRYQN